MISMKTCSFCGSSDHTGFYCRQKPNKPLSRIRRPRQFGKVQQATQDAVNEWKRTQKPNHQGYYQCYICYKLIDYLMAEHVMSKARHPERRTDPSNLRPTCAECNRLKGSRDML